MDNVPPLDTILDDIVDDIMKEFPEKSDLEASLMALRLNITILVQQMATIGMGGEGLSSESLYGVCLGLAQTCEWLASKEMAAEAMRDIEAS